MGEREREEERSSDRERLGRDRGIDNLSEAYRGKIERSED